MLLQVLAGEGCSLQYEQINRGWIQNREFAKQIVDFHGLKFGDITPTDIDGIIEYKNIAFIIYEFKYGNSRVPYGQYLCLRRLCDDLQESNKIAVLLICEHNTESCGKDIDAANATVRELYYQGKVFSTYTGKSVRDVTDLIIKCADKELCTKKQGEPEEPET